ncbi:hypothetical protein NQ315_011273 [Exocentrus adspersus]|uniref:Uncharacterized protein n=1 Tax=Exocentrus adspersus TaxID=1586481 RepID=A0AAV8V9U6_9CUCU|nr:hypothetical protein NQ315_011273 [Exocentrus adspersus]
MQFKGKPWWNKECDDAYKKQKAITKGTLRQSKRKGWKEYCSSLNKSTPLKEVWNKGQKNKQRPIDIENSPWIIEFHANISPLWTNLPFPDILQQIDLTSIPQQNRYLLQPFRIYELNVSLKQHNNTSPGMDNIHYSMLSNLPENEKIAMLVTDIQLSFTNNHSVSAAFIDIKGTYEPKQLIRKNE